MKKIIALLAAGLLSLGLVAGAPPAAQAAARTPFTCTFENANHATVEGYLDVVPSRDAGVYLVSVTLNESGYHHWYVSVTRNGPNTKGGGEFYGSFYYYVGAFDSGQDWSAVVYNATFEIWCHADQVS